MIQPRYYYENGIKKRMRQSSKLLTAMACENAKPHITKEGKLWSFFWAHGHEDKFNSDLNFRAFEFKEKLNTKNYTHK